MLNKRRFLLEFNPLYLPRIWASGLFACVLSAFNCAPAQTTNFTLGTTSLMEGPAAASDDVMLSVIPTSASWTASNSVTWLHLSPPNQSGIGGTNIIFSIDANPGGPRSGTITIAGSPVTITQAGSNYVSASGPGILPISGLSSVSGLTIDPAGNVYISDATNGVIKKWTKASLTLSNIVSTGLSRPAGLGLDSAGNLFIADSGNNAIKKWTATNGSVTTIVSSGLSHPAGVAVDASGNLFIADTGNNAIKQWTQSNGIVSTLASAGLAAPNGLALDVQGNVYFADTGNNSIKKWSISSGAVTAVVSASLSGPTGVAVDGSGNTYIADTGNNLVRKWNWVSNTLTTLISFGPGSPTCVAIDKAAGVYLGDGGLNVIRQLPVLYLNTGPWPEGANAGTDVLPLIYPASANIAGQIKPISNQTWLSLIGMTNGLVGIGFTANPGSNRTANINLFGQSIPVIQSGLSYSLGTTSLLEAPVAGSDSVVLGVAPDYAPWSASANAPWLHLDPAYQTGTGSTNLVFSFDANPGTTRSGTLTIAGQTLIVTQAGSTYVAVTNLATLVSVGAAHPFGVAVDGSGNVYFENSFQIKELATNGVTSTLVLSGLLDPSGISVDNAGNVYIADTFHNVVKEWVSASGVVNTLPIPGLNGMNGVGVDASGDVFVADTFNSAIKKYNAISGNVVTLVSSGLSEPCGVEVDVAGNVYIADYGNNTVMKWTEASGTMSSILASGLHGPNALAVDGSGNIYIADTLNSAIKKWSAASGNVATLISSGLSQPNALAVDGAGNVYIADTLHNAIKELEFALIDPTPKQESPDGGSDSLPPILPGTVNLGPPFAPSSDQTWLDITGITNGVLSFSTAFNPGQSRTAHISVLGQSVVINQPARTALPVFSPPSGTPLTNGATITISSSAAGAVIYYTTDVSPVSTNSPLYTGPITFTGPGPFTVQALAVPADPTEYSMATAVYYNPQAAAPVFFPPAGFITNNTPVSISCATPGAIIYYTLDGSVPSTNSTIYSNPPLISGGTVVSAVAAAAGYLNSAVASAGYSPAKLTIPQLTPGQGPLTNGTLISMTNLSSSAVIFYTTDGSTPTTNSTVYTRPLLFTNPVTLQAQAFASGYLPSDNVSIFYGLIDRVQNVAVTTFAGSSNPGLADGVGGAAAFSLPEGICIDPAGNLFVADTGNNCIRKILPSRQVITFAGNGMVLNSTNPTSTNAYFNGPVGVCLDTSGNVYVGDSGNCNRICRIGTDGSFAVYANVTLCGAGIGNWAPGLGQLVSDPAGNLYSGYWARAMKILPNGQVQTLAGTGCNCASTDWGVSVGLGIDMATNLYAASAESVWLIAPDGSVNRWAGGSAAYSDGPAGLSGFGTLTGAAVDVAGNIYLAEGFRIRKLSPTGLVSTVAGTGTAGYSDGPGGAAQFNGVYPWYLSAISHMGMCADAEGNLYVSDTANNCIRKVSFNTIALPILQISISTNLVTVSWPGWASNYVLQSSTSLPANGTWLPATNGGIAIQSGAAVVWTNTPGTGEMFFRLRGN